MIPRRFFASSRRSQRGSILVPAAMGLLIGAVLLGGIQVGYLIYAKRDMQKAADLAALTGAQVLSEGTAADCTQATQAATSAAQANTSSGVAQDMEVTCWRWDPVKNTADPRHLATAQTGERYNAVKMTLTRNVASMVPFMNGDTLTVESVAARPGNPVAAFSVGTTLVQTHGQPGNLIDLLAKAGVNLDGTALVGYDAGLTNVNVTTAGLLKALGIDAASDISVADLNHLLATNTVALDDLVTAVIAAGGKSDVLSANLLVDALKAKVNAGQLNVTLGSETPGRSSSLFANITAADGKSVLDANINALDLIATAVSVASKGHALQLQAPISIPGLLDITTSVGVIEPAQIAIGGVGTTAYSAQTRMFLQVTSKNLSLLGLINFQLDLPIAIDVAAAQGTLTDLCDTPDPSGRDLATIQVDSSLLETCVGDLTAANAFSSSLPCSTGLKNKQLLTLKVGAGSGPFLDLGVNNKITINPLHDPPKAVTLYAPQEVSVPTTSLALGDALANITSGLINGLLGGSAQQSTSASSSQVTAGATQLATKLWTDARAANSCNPDPPDQPSLFNIAAQQNAYNCRKQLWQDSLTLGQNQSADLATYISKQAQPPAALTGLGSVISNLTTGLTNLVSNLLSGLLGPLFSNNQCAGSGLSGTASGCVNEIAKSFAASVAPGTAPNPVPALLNNLLGLLKAPLNSLGTSLLALIQNTLGLEINSTDVRLISLQCNGKGVQLVY